MVLTTDRQIQNVKLSPGKVQESHRTATPGLMVKVSKTRKSFYVDFTENGKRKFRTIGIYESGATGAALDNPKQLLGLKSAATLARRIRAGEHLTTRKGQPTLVDLWEAYVAAEAKKVKQKAATTKREEFRRWENIIEPRLGTKLVSAITPSDLSTLLAEVAEKTPVAANRLHSLLSVMFKPALAMGWLTSHPLQWIDKPGGSEPPRERVLSDDEIRLLWPAMEQVSENARDALRLGLLTAQRPGEILAMRWEDIDFYSKIWNQSQNKTNVANLVPLSDAVTAILLNRRDNGSPQVFPSLHNQNRAGATQDGQFKSTKAARKHLSQMTGVGGWTAHDLRRTARTIMSRLKIKHHIRERILNHSQGGVSGVYDKYDYLEEKRAGLDLLAKEILGITHA